MSYPSAVEQEVQEHDNPTLVLTAIKKGLTHASWFVCSIHERYRIAILDHQSLLPRLLVNIEKNLFKLVQFVVSSVDSVYA